jgi:hypothetical protein
MTMNKIAEHFNDADFRPSTKTQRLLARLFGKKISIFEDNHVVVGRLWRGVLYVTKFGPTN